MKLLFHCNQLNERGTEVSTFNYAKYNEEILNNESVILYNTDNEINSAVLSKFNTRFKVLPYSRVKQGISYVNYICNNNNIDCVYFIKAGNNDNYLSNVKNIIHAVFQEYQPHGSCYAYISEWLSNTINIKYKVKTNWVPHIVSMVTPTETKKYTRSLLGIPKNALVIGRYGGADTFDIPEVYQTILKYLTANSNCYFVFLNTNKFIQHDRVIFCDSVVDEIAKSNFINMCDAMIHARSDGESFGLSICEFLYHNKPVFAFNEGHDLHHVQLLQSSDLIYTSQDDLYEKFNMLQDGVFVQDYHSLITKFSPKLVMEKFKTVFLQ